MELSRGSLSMKSNICEIQVLMPASTQLQQRPLLSIAIMYPMMGTASFGWLAVQDHRTQQKSKQGYYIVMRHSRTTWAHRRPSAIQSHARSSLSQSGDADSGREGV